MNKEDRKCDKCKMLVPDSSLTEIVDNVHVCIWCMGNMIRGGQDQKKKAKVCDSCVNLIFCSKPCSLLEKILTIVKEV